MVDEAWLILIVPAFVWGLWFGCCTGEAEYKSCGEDGEIPLETLDRWRARTEWRNGRPEK